MAMTRATAAARPDIPADTLWAPPVKRGGVLAVEIVIVVERVRVGPPTAAAGVDNDVVNGVEAGTTITRLELGILAMLGVTVERVGLGALELALLVVPKGVMTGTELYVPGSSPAV